MDRVKFVFSTPEQAVEYYAQHPSEYERERKITPQRYYFVFDQPNLKVGVIEKSDNSKSYLIVIRRGATKNLWVNWAPTQDQSRELPEIVRIIRDIENQNSARRLV